MYNQDMSAGSDLPSFVDPVGLFPLPHVVLFPGATLPLQIHEPRYRTMVADALADEAIIALALLRPGYEPYYHTNLAEIYPVVCVGRIREYIQLPDSFYFINLLGLCRARVRQEDRNGEYRLAMLDPMIWPDSGIEVDGQYAARESFRLMLSSSVFDRVDEIDRIRAVVNSSASLGQIVDTLASALLPADAVEVKQRMLEEINVLRRAETLVSELGTVHRVLETRQRSQSNWPRFGSMN